MSDVARRKTHAMNDAPRPMPAAPASLAHLDFGLYRGAVAEGPPTPSLPLASLRRKRWIYVGVYAPDAVIGVAVVDLGFAANAFAYRGALASPSKRAWSAVGPAWAAQVDRRRAQWSFGAQRITVSLPAGDVPGRVAGQWRDGGEVVELDLALHGGEVDGAVTCVAPAGDDARGRWNLTMKDNHLTAKGLVRWGSEAHAVDALAIADVTDAYPPRHTVWQWASCAGRDDAGRRVAMNLCALHNDSDRARENALWIDGVPRPLGAVRFDFDRGAPDAAPWRIEGDGVDLRFTPSGMREGKENLGAVRSRFVQPYGRFTGEVRVGGDRARFVDTPGVVEDHDALW